MTSDLTERVHTRCLELTGDFSHSSSSGDTGWAENIYWASWYADASTIFNKWYNSNGHYYNMIYCCCSSSGASMNCGIGVKEYDGQLYAVLELCGFNGGTPPASGYVATIPEETTVPEPSDGE